MMSDADASPDSIRMPFHVAVDKGEAQRAKNPAA